MEAGREALEGARESLLSSQPDLAERDFALAEAAFVQAHGYARNPLLRVASWLPVLGRTPDTAAGLATAGREVALAGKELAGSIANLPDGLASLGPRNGRIPIESYQALAPSLAEATRHLETAEAAVSRLPRAWLLGPVAEARSRLDAELTPLRRGLQAATLIVERFPAFLGADGPRRYLFAAENPAELRGTGGLIASLAVMTATDGRLRFSSFEANEHFPALPSIEPPNTDYARRYPGSAGYVLVANLTPDFPSAAIALQRMYEASRDVRLDGTIAADPHALEAMLRASGSVRVPLLGEVTSENVVALVANQAYVLVPETEQRSAALGLVAQAVLAQFLEDADPGAAATALAEAGGAGHITIHTDDEVLQEGLAMVGADGALPARSGDLLAPIVNNAGANKVDFFAERSLAYLVELGADHLGRGRLDLTLHNGAPTSGQPKYVIGPTGFANRGENHSNVDLFVSGETELLEYRNDGEPEGIGVDSELGYTVLPSSLRIPSGGTARVQYALANPSAWEGTAAHGTYRLTVTGQTTIIPTPLRVEIRAPAGTEIVRASPGVTVDGSRAVWEGTAASVLEIEIEFQKPFLGRAWDALTDFFRKRIVSF
jgi:hypothetical protein